MAVERVDSIKKLESIIWMVFYTPDRTRYRAIPAGHVRISDTCKIKKACDVIFRMYLPTPEQLFQPFVGYDENQCNRITKDKD